MTRRIRSRNRSDRTKRRRTLGYRKVKGKKNKKKKTRKKKMSGGIKPYSDTLQKKMDRTILYDTISTNDIKIPEVVRSFMTKQREPDPLGAPSSEDWSSGDFIFVIYADEPNKLYLSPEKWCTTNRYGHSSFPKTDNPDYNKEIFERISMVNPDPSEFYVPGSIRDPSGYYTPGDILLFAGTITFNKDTGELISWTNNSGHYRPSPLDVNWSTVYDDCFNKLQAARKTYEVLKNKTDLDVFHQSLDFDKLLSDLGITDKKGDLKNWGIRSVFELVRAKNYVSLGFDTKEELDEMLTDVFGPNKDLSNLFSRIDEITKVFGSIKELYTSLKELTDAELTFKRKNTSKILSENGMPLDKYKSFFSRFGSSPLYLHPLSPKVANENKAIEIWDLIN